MSAAYYDRIQRLRRLEALLPKPGTKAGDCLDGTRLLEIIGEAYGKGSPNSRRRALQRDLEALVKDGRIEAVNPGGKPLRYRRMGHEVDEDVLIWEYTLRQVRDLIAEAVPKRQLDRLWERLLHEGDCPLLSDQQLRVVPDSLRLRPVELYPEVLHAVISALAQQCALQVVYRNAAGERSRPLLHPQALVQRGPIPYLFALKNDEDDLRLYALHRFIRAEIKPQIPARAAEDFDLDRALAEGKIDFGRGEQIELVIRVRGYLTPLLLACPLSENQTSEEEPDDSDFDVRLQAQLPQTGQLLRWLLGAGDNLQVLAPVELRHVLAEQARKMAGLYPSDPDDPIA
ncbi:WYL domain-containing protein [Lamprobacter modestohalophilus]|uniref:helix-turn-helix transcriptional regulator n=1 Tax=Lamprobacter modestohalophilus TaxID=1064514 RepID=UPI002ADED2C1|nr:WYL domain-containing protein [Lamprobacter modestohalophilus]MEA1051263.1 WYL domain-containing protein [Lamprobacter modestohalophilus]